MKLDMEKLGDSIFAMYNDIGMSSGTLSIYDHFYSIDTSPSVWPRVLYNATIDLDNYNMVCEEIRNGSFPKDILIKNSTMNKNLKLKFAENFDKLWELPGMYINVSNTNLFAYENTDLFVEAVTDEETLDEWATLVINVFFKTDSVQKIEALCKTVKPSLREGKLCCLIGRVLGKIVAASLLHINDDVFGIHHVCVESENRRMGYGFLMTTESIQYARSKGCAFGVLISTQMGQNMYKNIGFEEFESYTKYRLKS